MSQNAASIISLTDVSFSYPQLSEQNNNDFALKNINLNIEEGEFVAILGHNGSGKSTLAKLLNALLIPTSGTVTVNGFDTNNEKNTWNIRQSCGMVFQNPDNQIIATVVEEDVAFGAENLGIPPDEIRVRVDTALQSLGMSKHSKVSPHFLSGGQKQRVAIAGILAMRPKCIVLDEPTAMLDPQGRKEVMSAIHKLKKENGITVVLITHFMDEAVQADRVVLMDRGEISGSGTPRQVFSDVDRLEATGLDVPQVTLCVNMLRKLGAPLPDGILTIEEAVAALTTLKRSR